MSRKIQEAYTVAHFQFAIKIDTNSSSEIQED